MYYHTEDIKYITYGKLLPAPIESVDDYMLKAYSWLGKYCGYCPQIWMSRSRNSITGYKNKTKQKKTNFFGARRNFEPNVMFSFDIVKGFPVDYDVWCYLLNTLFGCQNPIKDGDDAIKRSIEEWIEDYNKNKNDYGPVTSDDIMFKWQLSSNLNDFLNKYLFVENDQVVVPTLNLKVAKQIFCRNERQIKLLRHMGFIKDRIKILNSKQWN